MSHMPAYGEGGSSCADSGSCGGPRIVEYTATGAESPAGFTVPIGATLAAATYHVGFFGAAGADEVPWAWDFPSGSRTTTSFVAKFSGDALPAGAVYKFQIVEA